jgi:hypothetical protein
VGAVVNAEQHERLDTIELHLLETEASLRRMLAELPALRATIEDALRAARRREREEKGGA